jgi:hypothetical protein
MQDTTTTTHTSGPWAHQNGKVYGDGLLVATLDPPQLEEEVAMKEADARLIAAAPAMLEALQGMVDEFQDAEWRSAAISTARAAIAKATGGAA